MITITATELRNNLKKYISLSKTQEIFVTWKNQTTFKLVYHESMDALKTHSFK
jgi:hypothetical protein